MSSASQQVFQQVAIAATIGIMESAGDSEEPLPDDAESLPGDAESLPDDVESLPDMVDDEESGVSSLSDEFRSSSTRALARPLLSDSHAAAIPDDVIEIFSAPRVVPAAASAGLRAQLSIDILTGQNLLNPHWQRWTIQQVESRRPRVVISSPPCTLFSTLMNWNRPKMDPVVFNYRWQEACAMLEFGMLIAAIQKRAGRGFVHEHPSPATSWRHDSVLALPRPPFTTLDFHQCRFNLRSPQGFPLKKSTRLLSCNLPTLTRHFQRKCNCTARFWWDGKAVLHRPIMGSENGVKLSHHAQHYPPAMVDAFVQVIKDQSWHL